MNKGDLYSRIYFGWSFEKTKLFYKSNRPKEGDLALVVSTQHNCFVYEAGKISRVSDARIYFDKSFGYGGPSFYYSGKNCWSPKGQTRLIPPLIPIISLISNLNEMKLIFTEFQRGELLKFLDDMDAKISDVTTT